jgi:hypothetical protein
VDAVLAATDSNLSAKAFKFGLFDGSRTGFTPAFRSSVESAVAHQANG